MYKLADRVIAIRAMRAKTKAFSLVEMLMALLVASLLLAALAPVMTKKINEKVNFEGLVPTPTRKKIVYLTEPGVGEWVVPNGIRSYKVTTVGAGGGGGASGNNSYGKGGKGANGYIKIEYDD